MSANNISGFAHEIEKYYLQETLCLSHVLVVIEIPSSHFAVQKELTHLSRMQQVWGERPFLSPAMNLSSCSPDLKELGEQNNRAAIHLYNSTAN